MAQFARPTGTVTTGPWSPSTGATLWGTIDESTASDTDYDTTGTNDTGDMEVSLGSISAPAAGTRTVRYRYSKDASGGNSRNITVSLYQGTTLINEQSHTNISNTWTAGSFTVTGTITNYADLRIRVNAGGSTGGNPGNRRAVRISWVEFETPNQNTDFSGSTSVSHSSAVTASGRKGTSKTVSVSHTHAVTASGGPPVADDYYNAMIALSMDGYWRLHETSGTDVLDEIASTDGTYTGTVSLDEAGPLRSGLGAAVDFAGTGYADFGDVLDLGDTCSVGFWFKRNAFGVGGTTSQYLYSAGTLQPNIFIYDGNDGIFVNDNDAVTMVASSRDVSDRGWHFLVYTRNGTGASGQKLYLDGKEVSASQAGSPSFAGSSSALVLGADYTGSQPFDGRMSEAFNVDGVVLTPAEILNLFEIGVGGVYPASVRGKGARHYYRMGTTGMEDELGDLDGSFGNSPSQVSGPIDEDDGARAFNGSTQYGIIPHDSTFDFGDVFTLELWFRRTGTYGVNYAYMLSKANSFATQFNSADEIVFDNDGSVCSSSLSTFTDSDWHHLMLVRDGANDYIFIDGVDDTNTGTDAARSNTTEDVHIARYWADSDYGALEIDEVAFYPVALSEADALENFEAGISSGPSDTTSVNHSSSVTASGQKGGQDDVDVAQTSATTAAGFKAASGSTSVNHTSSVSATGAKAASQSTTVSHTSGVATSGFKGGQSDVGVAHSSAVTLAETTARTGAATTSQTSSVTTSGSKQAAGDVDVTHSQTATGSATTQRAGDTDVAHTHDITIVGSALQAGSGSTSVSHASGVSASGQKNAQGAASASSLASVAVQGAGGHLGAVSVTAASSVAPLGISGRFGAISVPHTHAVTIVPATGEGGSTSVNHTSATSASGSKATSGGATVSQSSSVATTGQKNAFGSTSVSHSSSTSASGNASAAGEGQTTVSHTSSVSTSGFKGGEGNIAASHSSGVAPSGSKGGVSAITVGHTSATSGTGSTDRSGVLSVTGSSLVAVLGSKQGFGQVLVPLASSVTISATDESPFPDDATAIVTVGGSSGTITDPSQSSSIIQTGRWTAEVEDTQ